MRRLENPEPRRLDRLRGVEEEREKVRLTTFLSQFINFCYIDIEQVQYLYNKS